MGSLFILHWKDDVNMDNVQKVMGMDIMRWKDPITGEEYCYIWVPASTQLAMEGPMYSLATEEDEETTLIVFHYFDMADYWSWDFLRFVIKEYNPDIILTDARWTQDVLDEMVDDVRKELGVAPNWLTRHSFPFFA